jgi:hypothetical protein
VKILDEEPDARPSTSRLPIIVGAALLVAGAVAAIWLLARPPAPATPRRAAPAPAPVATEPPVAATPAPSSPAPAPVRRSAPKAKAPPAPAEPAAPTPTVKVDSDVPGADVFVDRVYLGKTPLTTSDVQAGSHTLTAAAEGYESQAVPIDVNAGANEVRVRFRVVRLNETIPVVHKHAIGSCEGRLIADTHGLRYQTPNKDHAFDVPFAQLKSFEVDYLQKNLRVTRTDGKTFNFTDRNKNADALFVFHQKVEAARAKLAAGVPPGDK